MASYARGRITPLRHFSNRLLSKNHTETHSADSAHPVKGERFLPTANWDRRASIRRVFDLKPPDDLSLSFLSQDLLRNRKTFFVSSFWELHISLLVRIIHSDERRVSKG